jgi:hypothetical protein
MTKTNKALPLAISFQIPTYWTPEQAFAVFELVNDLRDAIWRCYAVQLQDQYRDQLQPTAADHGNVDPDKPPF